MQINGGTAPGNAYHVPNTTDLDCTGVEGFLIRDRKILLLRPETSTQIMPKVQAQPKSLEGRKDRRMASRARTAVRQECIPQEFRPRTRCSTVAKNVEIPDPHRDQVPSRIWKGDQQASTAAELEETCVTGGRHDKGEEDVTQQAADSIVHRATHHPCRQKEDGRTMHGGAPRSPSAGARRLGSSSLLEFCANRIRICIHTSMPPTLDYTLTRTWLLLNKLSTHPQTHACHA
ncbi:hypothetical protein MVEN_00046300 [Mycena venus]|uniref:Uncharacterized protein n=1 Tax=Mycena venus TaxID=2733690 RepID=A0A8H7DEY7_9AGAR|nr:hypothetical protein MVEN_00046300 [Mycena venus]